ncbi:MULTISPECIES: NlpC/P60 family protein [unclassified Solwaraspora]|uniref:C40 family peptidase n=1 Tax=unclassified Solwaraspora TaxID=2627926 RepID=UPI00248B03A8|nr:MULTISPECIES: NlpC/P60 family protein [unclassified Solwaraspora]WBB96938.1 NlpC/P60 family protein [Solwaraspora sp. WMMA2059]WBC19158.1 NlpC/P60 family protein [Solwaraspora sp. WMMA2080]WJK33427.1 NlpC/P60 family protein [Solwaraspora sp. WMMA2065]
MIAATTGVGLLLVGAPAQAQPTVAEIESQIDEVWAELEPTIERHNAVRQDLAAKKKQADELQKKIKPLQIQIDLAMDRVSEFAARSYKGGSPSVFNAILTNGKPTHLADQLELLDQFARRQARDVQAVVDLRNEYAAKKAPLDELIVELTSTEAQLAAKAKEIDAEVDRLQDLRLEAYGSTNTLGSLRPAPCPATYPGGAAGKAVTFACAQIGKPYVWGSAGPGSYDCSGLTLAAWGQAGVSLPHNAARQRQVTANVSRDQLRPGDLIFYYSGLSHVGMYVGNGWIVHASQAGEPVQMRKIGSSVHSYGRPG